MLDFARVTELITPRLRRPATWVWVTLGVALSGATAHVLQSRISAGFEHVADASTSVAKELWCQHRNASTKLSDNRFTILVSPLQGDPNRTQTEEMIDALMGQGGVQLLRVCQSLQIDTEGERVIGLIRAIEQGQAILKERHADLILFGKVSAIDNSARIWAVNEHGGCENSLQPIKLERGAGSKFASDTKAQLYGAVLKEIAAACRHKDDMDWDLFKKQMRKLTYLVFEYILKLPEEQQAELSTSYYNGLNLLYNHDGDVVWFKAASAFTDLLLNSKATDLAKLNARVFKGRALVSKGFKTNDKDALAEGIEMLEHALPLIPSSRPAWRVDVLTTLASAYSGKGDVGLAIQKLDEAISLIPVSVPERRAEVLRMRAAAHRRKGDEGLVIKDLDEAIRLRPQDSEALNDRCFELAKIGRLDQALADCNASLNLRPNHPNILDSRGFTYLKLKKPEKAINDYDAALQFGPQNAYSLYGRGLAHLMLGNNDQGNHDIAAAKALKAEIVDEFARSGVK